jgi:hypothetical protein
MVPKNPSSSLSSTVPFADLPGDAGADEEPFAAETADADGVAPSERGALGATLDPFAPAEFSDGGEGPRELAAA